VRHVRRELGISERRACRTLGQPRSTQRYEKRLPEDEEQLVERIESLACEYGRYGYRRITALLRREGLEINHKRVQRIWRQEGLRVPRRQPKRGRLWLGDGSCIRLRPQRKDHVWAYDFVEDRTHDGRKLRILSIVDEYTREWLDQLAALFMYRGIPKHIRSDNGPEFTVKAVRDWLSRIGVKTLFIEPGSPWENGYVESFNGKFRDEFLDRELFYSLEEARVLTEMWRQEYNHVRPHGALGYRPPAPVARLLAEAGSATLRRPRTLPLDRESPT
jgi:transposase InsO family protein